MSQVIYHLESTYFLTRKTFKTVGAAKAHLTREEKKAARLIEIRNIYKRFDTPARSYSGMQKTLIKHGLTRREIYNASCEPREIFNRADYAIAGALDFQNNIEKTRTTSNILNPKAGEFEIPVNTPNSCDPGSETYHCM